MRGIGKLCLFFRMLRVEGKFFVFFVCAGAECEGCVRVGEGVAWGRRISLVQEIKSFCFAYLPGIERCAEPSKSGWCQARGGMWRDDGGGVVISRCF